MIPGFFRSLSVCLLLILFLLWAPRSSAQYKLLWEKPVQQIDLFQEPKNITGISPLDGGYLILFKLRVNAAIDLPAFAYLDRNDRLWPVQFLDIDSLAEVTLIGAARRDENLISIMANDYTDRHDGKPIPLPFEIVLARRATDTEFGLFSSLITRVTDVQGVRSFAVADNTTDGKNGHFLSIVRTNASNIPLGFLYHMPLGQKMTKAQFDEVSDIKIWFADQKTVLVETEVTLDNKQRFYQIHVLDHDLNEIQTYPSSRKSDIVAQMAPGVSDRLVRLSYRPGYDLGFATRQVRNKLGENVLGWYTFNGLNTPNPVFKQVGIEGDVQASTGPVLPDNEEVITDGDLNTGNTRVDNMVVAVDHKRTGSHDLVLSVADYYGLETSRQVIPGYIDSLHSVVKAWANDNNEVYVVANTQKSLTDGTQGLYISKWKATDEAIGKTWHKIKTTMHWSADPFYSKEPIAEIDKTEFILLGIDSSDANYADREDLVGKKIKLEEGGLHPLRSSYWFSGTVRIGRKKYVLTKFAIAKADK